GPARPPRRASPRRHARLDRGARGLRGGRVGPGDRDLDRRMALLERARRPRGLRRDAPDLAGLDDLVGILTGPGGGGAPPRPGIAASRSRARAARTPPTGAARPAAESPEEDDAMTTTHETAVEQMYALTALTVAATEAEMRAA